MGLRAAARSRVSDTATMTVAFTIHVVECP